MTNPGNNPFPPDNVTQSEFNALKNTIENQLTRLDRFNVVYQFPAGPDSRILVMSSFGGLNSTTSAQVPRIRLNNTTVKKIFISTNLLEFTGGTMKFRLYKNSVRTGTPIFDTGNLPPGAFPLAVDAQGGRWYDVNFSLIDTDYLTAQFTANSVTGAPEGIYMDLWGVRT